MANARIAVLCWVCQKTSFIAAKCLSDGSAICCMPAKVKTAKKGFGRTRPTNHASGRRDDLGKVFFRSSWEANWARYLNFQKENGFIDNWDFEKETFWFEGIARGTVSYLCDFRVYDKNGMHLEEVKGYMDAKSKTKIRRMRKYHPHIKMMVIDRPRYMAVQKALGKVIPHWEFPKKK